MLDSQIVVAIITAIPASIIAIFVAKINKNQLRLQEQQAELANKEAQRQLFEKFNERFDKLNEFLNDIPANKSLSELEKHEERSVQDYLNLCSEEYLWRTRGLIDSVQPNAPNVIIN